MTGSSIQSLTIKNLISESLSELTKLPASSAMLSKVEELHDQFCHRGISEDEDVLFMDDFILTWLAVASKNLRGWTFYYVSYQIGFHPLFPSHLQMEMPKFTSLALGQLGFTSEDQFSWILRQRSLKTLMLDHCLINHQGSFLIKDLPHWLATIEASDLIPVVDDDLWKDGWIVGNFLGRWYSFLDQFPLLLQSHLNDKDKEYIVVEMECPADRAFDNRNMLSTDFSRDSIYAGFVVETFRTLLPVHAEWVTGTYLYPGFLPCYDDDSPANTCWNLDTRPLGALLEKIKSRRSQREPLRFCQQFLFEGPRG